MRPLYQLSTPLDEPCKYWCNPCEQYKAAEDFHSSDIAKHRRRCRSCNSKQTMKNRNRNVFVKMLYDFKQSERSRIHRLPPSIVEASWQTLSRLEAEDVRELVHSYLEQNRHIPVGDVPELAKGLRLCLRERREPFSLENLTLAPKRKVKHKLRAKKT